MAEAPGAECRLCEALPVVGMAKSSCECARKARAKGEAEERAAARKAVAEAFEASGGTYGHRRITAVAGVGEWTVRDIMRDERLVARAARRKRRHSPYGGEISEAPENLLRDERGKHRFGAASPTSRGSPTRPSSASPPAGRASRPSWTAPAACRWAGRSPRRPTPGWPTRRCSARVSDSAGATIPRSARTATVTIAGRDG